MSKRGKWRNGLDDTVRRLAAQFPAIEPYVVRNCVRDTRNCAAHLGVDVAPEVLERLAREHLLTLESSVELDRDHVPAQRRAESVRTP